MYDINWNEIQLGDIVKADNEFLTYTKENEDKIKNSKRVEIIGNKEINTNKIGDDE